MGSICTKNSSEPNVEAANEREAATGQVSSTNTVQETELVVEATGTADESSANVTENTEALNEAVNTVEVTSTVVIEEDIEITESTSEVPEEAKQHMSTFTIQDKRLSPPKLTLEVGGPLTVTELKSTLDGKGQLFIVEFLHEKDQIAFLDTLDYRLSYRTEEDIRSSYNLSILMMFEPVEAAEDGKGPDITHVKWKTLVMPNRYLTVTESTSIIVDSGLGRILEFEEYPTVDDKPNPLIPIWTVTNAKDEKKLIFSHKEIIDETEWFSFPGEEDALPGEEKKPKMKQVFGVKELAEDKKKTTYVRHVKGVTANSVPYVKVGPHD